MNNASDFTVCHGAPMEEVALSSTALLYRTLAVPRFNESCIGIVVLSRGKYADLLKYEAQETPYLLEPINSMNCCSPQLSPAETQQTFCDPLESVTVV
ncbi:hypothetical protein KIN20_016876 [Parelaphostrongylus tenuis]|uniref:Uncharacterized protein n=1 Tax=Parelaphostrongylus tenuis TaxID=148309 RepID=A0AAD5QR28_PARTN|nr:hypothetical protein KIN20_016876 [Parelaphostrongylus tenuis]